MTENLEVRGKAAEQLLQLRHCLQAVVCKNRIMRDFQISFAKAFLKFRSIAHCWLLRLWRSSHPLLVVAHRTWPESGLHENINIFALYPEIIIWMFCVNSNTNLNSLVCRYRTEVSKSPTFNKFINTRL